MHFVAISKGRSINLDTVSEIQHDQKDSKEQDCARVYFIGGSGGLRDYTTVTPQQGHMLELAALTARGVFA